MGLDERGRAAGAIVNTELDRLERQLFEADWATARAVHGPAATANDLARTAAQRHADALTEMARRSAHQPPGSKPARPLLSVLVGRLGALPGDAHRLGRQDHAREVDERAAAPGHHRGRRAVEGDRGGSSFLLGGVAQEV